MSSADRPRVPSRRPPHRRRSFAGGSPSVAGTNDLRESAIDERGITPDDDGQPQDAVGRMLQMVDELQHTVRLQSMQIHSLKETVRSQNGEIHTLKEEVQNLERWAVFAAPIPGWGENEGAFLANFKKHILELSHGTSRGRIGINAPDGFGECFDYGILLAYWKELGEALHRPISSENGATSFHVKDIKLWKNVLDLLAPGLKTQYFKTLSFENNRFGREGIKFVMDIIEHNPELEALILVQNPIESNEDVNVLCDLINQHPSLKKVVIEECGSWTPSDLLYPVLTASDRLMHISLEGCNLSTMGRTEGLVDFLSSNYYLEVLNLKGNQLNDDDAVLIAQALETNRTLKWLDLEANNITNVGKDALFRTIFNPADLNAVAECNHTCGFNLDINGIRELPSIINVKYGSPRLVLEMRLLLPNTVRKMKLLTLLSAPYEKTVNVNLLKGVPLALIPEVLEFVVHYPAVAYVFPDSLNTQLHWGFMAALRPDTPQTEREEEEEADSDGSVCTERAQQNEDSGDIYNSNWSRYDGYDSAEEENPKPAQVKRLNMVYEILRRWRTDAGDTLCAQRRAFHCSDPERLEGEF